jgi:hypothetical protein
MAKITKLLFPLRLLIDETETTYAQSPTTSVIHVTVSSPHVFLDFLKRHPEAYARIKRLDIFVEAAVPPLHVSVTLGPFQVNQSPHPDHEHSWEVYAKHWTDLFNHLAQSATQLDNLTVYWDTLRLSEDDTFLSALGSIKVAGNVTLRGTYPTSSVCVLRKQMCKHFTGFSSKTLADMSWKVNIEHQQHPRTSLTYYIGYVPNASQQGIVGKSLNNVSSDHVNILLLVSRL